MNEKLILLAAGSIGFMFAAAQNVGIGTTTPMARLHVADSAVVFTRNTTAYNTNANPPIQGAGIRMMWYPEKAAFRVGCIEGGQWNRDSIGTSSFAAGFNSKATGNVSTAFGVGSVASGNYSIVMGYKSTASGTISTAMGWESTASGAMSTATGINSLASGIGSTAIGINSLASGYGSTAMGWESTASGDNSTAMGYFSVASGEHSTVIGLETKAKAYVGLSAGLFNDTLDTPLPTIPEATDRIFQIGNGTADNARSNALTVLRNGNTGIGTVNPTLAGLVVDTKAGAANAMFGSNTTGVAIESSFPGIGLNTYYNNGRRAIANGYGSYIGTDPLNGGLQFYVTNASYTAGANVALNTGMVITPIGNVGIGTAGTNAPLQFTNDTRNRKIVMWEGSNNDHQYYGFGVNGFTLRYQVPGLSDAHVFYAGNSAIASNELFRISGNGNATLAGTLTQNSDARLKKNITPLGNMLSLVGKLNGYSYNWKEASRDNTEQIGLLAQELQELLPQLVKEDDKGTLSVNYSGMVPVLLEAIKEQQKQIEEMKKENWEIKEMLKLLLKK
ncbi:MAG: tail fiber domain-containing protein [Ferruginibacter sp.]